MLKVVILDNNPAIRQVLKDVVHTTVSSLHKDYRIYSSGNGVEGLGLIFAVDPEVIIIDTTLPKFSGSDIIDIIHRNEFFLTKKLIILHEDNFESVPKDFPKNYHLISKSNEYSLSQIIKVLDNKNNSSSFKLSILQHTFNKANKIDHLVKKSKNPFRNVLRKTKWLLHQAHLFLLITLVFATSGFVKDDEVIQGQKDNEFFKTRSVSTFATFFVAILLVALQMLMLTTGGIVIFNQKIHSVFADYSKEIVIDLQTAKYGETAIQYSEESLKLIPLSSENAEILYPTEAKEITFEEGIEYSSLESILENSSLNGKDTSVPKQEELILVEDLKVRELKELGITYQLSPDNENWYYYSGEKIWEKTDQGWISSNTIQEVNQFLSLFSPEVGGETKELFIKVFLKSDGITNTQLNELTIQRELQMITAVGIETQSENVVDTSATETTPESFPSYPEGYSGNQQPPTTQNTKENMPVEVWVPEYIDIKDSEVSIDVLNASYVKGHKKIAGVINTNGEINPADLDKLIVRIVYTEDTDTAKTFENVGDLIGEIRVSSYRKDNRTFYAWELDVESEEGGFVAAILQYKDTEVTELAKSKPIENSTFTVNEGGDQADFSVGDGLCDHDNATIGVQCSLRAAIEESNSLAGSDNISFNIPTTDASYRDYDIPNTANSGDSSGGDDYWSIRPSTALPAITDTVILDAFTQRVNKGNANTLGPEIELNGVNLATGGGLQFSSTPTNSSVNSIVINNFINSSSGIGIYVNQAQSLVITSSYIGTDVKSLTPKINGMSGIRVVGNAIVTIGNSTSDGNVVSGNARNIYIDNCNSAGQTIIKGNKIGLDQNTNLIPGNTNVDGIYIVNSNCNVQVGGALTAERNYIGGNLSHGILFGLPGGTFNIGIYNNYFGTNSTGTQNRANGNGTNPDIRIQNGIFSSPSLLEIGAQGKGNLFKFSARGVWLNEVQGPIIIGFNSFGNHSTRSILIDNDSTLVNQNSIINNYIGQSNSDPYFGVFLNGSKWGIQLRDGGIADIKGNYIRGNTEYGILLDAATSYGNRLTGTAATLPKPTIGGSSVLTGSLCNGLEENCIMGNALSGIYSLESVPLNESTLYSDNDFLTGNGPSNNRNIMQDWFGIIEILSGSDRRTDLVDGSLTYTLPSSIFAKNSLGTQFTTLQNYSLTCLADPAIDSNCSGVDSSVGALNRQGFSSFLAPNTSVINDVASWPRITEYVINGAGQLVHYSSAINPTKIDSAHLASLNFSFDGNATTHPATNDIGEPWTNNDTATRNIATSEFSRFQIMQASLVDANPVWNGTTWVITVDSTSDEDNVSISGFDDGSGNYSGGGINGTDGLSNGKTSLREAIIVANNFAQPVIIEFNIPTTDSGYRDFDSPDTPSSGDNLGADDYWTIRPTKALPNINAPATLDGSMQTTYQGNKNSAGPEVEVNFVDTSVGLPMIAAASTSNVTVKSLVINNSSFRNISFDQVTSGSIENSFIGLNVRGTDISTTLAVTNVYIINSTNLLIKDNIIAGGGILNNINIESSNTLNIFGNKIGISSSGGDLYNGRGGIRMLGDTHHIQIGNGVLANRNIISGHNDELFARAIYIDHSMGALHDIFIEGNYIGLDPSGTLQVGNDVGVLISSAGGAVHYNINIGGETVDKRNMIAGSAQNAIHMTVVRGSTGINIKNNFIGSDKTGAVAIPNNRGILIYGVEHDSLTALAVPEVNIESNLIRYNTTQGILVSDRTYGIDIIKNEISNNGGEGIYLNTVAVCDNPSLCYFSSGSGHQTDTITPPGTGLNVNQAKILNNRIGSGTSTILTNKILGGNGTGIKLFGDSSAYIQGNQINGNITYGIYAQPAPAKNLDYNRVDAYSLLKPRPLLGGLAQLSGSLCVGIEKNCTSGNGKGGVLFVDTLPANEGSIYQDNIIRDGYEQSWFGLIEILSGADRRTDMSDSSFDLTLPTNLRVKDSNGDTFTNLENVSIDCLADPATDTHCNGTNISAGELNRQGFSAFMKTSTVALDISDAETWPRFTEYTIDDDGNKTIYGGLSYKFEMQHIASEAFSFDGSALTDPPITDIGEPWTNDTSATRDVNLADFSLFQIAEIHLVDANPIWNGSNWIITVDSTSDEDNVSLAGVNDGSGSYSGGGVNGIDGLPNGQTSLREALIVANTFGEPVTIEFDIPQDDPGHVAYSDDGVAESFDPSNSLVAYDDSSADVDSPRWWKITLDGPNDDLPIINSEVHINGYSQTGAVEATDEDPAVLKIELSGENITIIDDKYGIQFGNGSTGSLRGLAINGFDNDEFSHAIATNQNSGGIVISGNHIGTDISGRVGKDNSNGINPAGVNLTIGGPNPEDRNIISGNEERALTNHGGVGPFLIQNNWIGINSLGEALPNGTSNNYDHVIALRAGLTEFKDNIVANNEGGILISRSQQSSSDPRVLITDNQIYNNVGVELSSFTDLDNNDPVDFYRSNIIYDDSGDTSILIDLVGGNEDSNGVTQNDVGDLDDGPNNLQNHAIITNVEYIGDSLYKISGSIDANPSELPIEIEICKSRTNGGCIESLGLTTVSSVDAAEVEGQSSSGESWFSILEVEGTNGNESTIFSTLTTNANGSTSEFGQTFTASVSNPNYNIGDYSINLVSPIGGVNTTTQTTLFRWTNGPDKVDILHLYLNGSMVSLIDGDSESVSLVDASKVGTNRWFLIGYMLDENGQLIEVVRSEDETYKVTKTNPTTGGGTNAGSVISYGVTLKKPENGSILNELEIVLEWEFTGNLTQIKNVEIILLNKKLGKEFTYLVGPTYKTLRITDPRVVTTGEYEWFIRMIEKRGKITESEKSTFSIDTEFVDDVTDGDVSVSDGIDVDGNDVKTVAGKILGMILIPEIPLIVSAISAVVLAGYLFGTNAILWASLLHFIPFKRKSIWGYIKNNLNEGVPVIEVILEVRKYGQLVYSEVGKTHSYLDGSFGFNTELKADSTYKLRILDDREYNQIELTGKEIQDNMDKIELEVKATDYARGFGVKKYVHMVKIFRQVNILLFVIGALLSAIALSQVLSVYKILMFVVYLALTIFNAYSYLKDEGKLSPSFATEPSSDKL